MLFLLFFAKIATLFMEPEGYYYIFERTVTMVSIKGKSKAKVLKALYDHSHVQGLGFLQAVPEGTVTIEHCEELLKKSTYFDYLYGRVLKVDLSGDEFNEWLYDRDCGEGAAQRAVDSVK